MTDLFVPQPTTVPVMDSLEYVPPEELIRIRVLGEPQPFPKKDVAMVGKRLVPVDHDYRERTNPHTRKIEKYDRGYKRRWMELCRTTALAVMRAQGRQPFPKNHPVAMGCLFFLTRAKSCKLPFPSQAPDQDNLEYAIRNALKRTPRHKGRDGPYPKGICFYDDDQIVWRALPDGMLWARPGNPPGVLITIYDFAQYPYEGGYDIDHEGWRID